MPYDPVAQSGSWFATGGIQRDEQGRPFTMTSQGRKLYLSPGSMGDYSGTGPQAKPDGNGFVRGRAQWDSSQGVWNRPINWGNLMALGVGGAIAAPAVIGAAAGAGAGGAAGGAGAVAPAATAGAGTTAATTAATLAPHAASIGSLIAQQAIPQGIGSVTSLLAGRSANKANEKAAAVSAAASKYAADLEAKAADEALAWLKEQHAQREAQLTPYRNAGTGAIAQLMQPIPGGR